MRFLVRLMLMNAVVIPVMAFAPVIWFLSPLTFFFVGPFSCGFYCLISCHWTSVRQAQREDRLHTWRHDHGGILVTASKAFVYMVLGITASFCFELLVLNCLRLLLFAAYLPLVILWLNRWRKHATEA
jgi:hypothetical protein